MHVVMLTLFALLCLQGVNSYDSKFPAIRDYLGLPANTTTIPLNLVNATVAYAVSDIVWCDSSPGHIYVLFIHLTNRGVCFSFHVQGRPCLQQVRIVCVA